MPGVQALDPPLNVAQNSSIKGPAYDIGACTPPHHHLTSQRSTTWTPPLASHTHRCKGL